MIKTRLDEIENILNNMNQVINDSEGTVDDKHINEMIRLDSEKQGILFTLKEIDKIIDEFEAGQLKQNVPEFGPGDTVVVQVRVKEGNRERLQAYEGVVIAKKNRGLNSSFTVRKISHGEGVERVFQLHSPSIADIKLKRRGDVRRAKLYYLRERSGKSARIKEKIG